MSGADGKVNELLIRAMEGTSAQLLCYLRQEFIDNRITEEQAKAQHKIQKT
jgi:hypothetical protein